VTKEVRERVIALGKIFAEDVAQALGLDLARLDPAWKEWSEALACNVFAEGNLERVGAAGALLYTTSRLPEK